MPPSRQEKRKNAIIQKEQTQLLTIQKELEEVLNQINDTVNVLKVEELQLKSSAVVFENRTSTSSGKPTSTCRSFADVPTTSWSQHSNFVDSSINGQVVDLDLDRLPIAGQDIEEEDE